MKKTIITLLCAAAVFSAAAQEKEMKTGWSFGLLPSLTYSSDLGLQYGAFGDVYYYGNGDTYPDPLHKISWEASHFTKGRTRLYLAYDSKYLIPGMRVNASVTYMDDPMYGFWGFNGPASGFDKAYWSNKETHINRYGMGRKMFRALANVQGHITDHLNWAAGLNFWNWKMADMADKYGYDTNETLYKMYRDNDIIHADEAQGGNALEINAGLVYDTRDIEAAPNKGVWAEAYLNGNVLQHKYLKACLYFRQYIDIPIHFKAGDPVFAYRLAWQQTIAGETPFYMIQNIPLLVQRNMITEGFGSFNTIRGMHDNRILAEGFAWTNMELRVKLVAFKLFNQFFYVAANPFFDCGVITKGYRDGLLSEAISDKSIYDSSLKGTFLYTAGAGLKIAMNQNFIVSAEFSHNFNKGLGEPVTISIGTNYQF
jgi:hypothetical protein